MAAFLGFYVIALVSGYFSGRRRRFGGFAGLFQRLSVFTALVWIAVLAGRLVAARLA
jgi:hypothetical protein